MSAAEQFKAAVTSASAPGQGWRGGLERSRARRGRRGGGESAPPSMAGKNKKL